MMKNIWNSILVLAATGVLVLACSKNKDDDTPPGEANTLEITSFAPLTQEVGKTVTITGKNFATTTSGNVVQFNGVNASLNSATATQLVAVVPNGDVDGKIKVTVGTETATSIKDFTLAIPEPQGPSVYVAGRGYDNSKAIAMFWKDGQVTFLTDGENEAGARSIAVREDGVVYNAGFESLNNTNQAKVWIDDDEILLTDGQNEAIANSIFLAGTDYYVTGFEEEDGRFIAKVWKNGKEYDSYTFDETSDTFGESIYVSGTDLYVAGYQVVDGYEYARVWKNGEPIYLEHINSNDARALSVYVEGDDVYVAGHEFNLDPYNYIARAWENGEVILSTDAEYHAYAHSIMTADSDTYIAGDENNQAVLWVNAEPKILSGGEKAFSVYVYDNDVFVAGYGDYGEETAGFVWKNDEEPIELLGGDGSTYANAVYVK
ncbi:IPT/TIG domain-containing protein [Flagellimonas sp.]|uniref:IPT/TIG domain-containing protein n=1 Tax=Flagellimonas sp. TaxID=2058762 RepID=UPI003BAF61F4